MPINRDVYIADDTKPNKRRKIVKTSKVDLIDALYEYYENPYNDKNKLTLAYIYPEWKAFKALHVAETYISRIETSWKKY